MEAKNRPSPEEVKTKIRVARKKAPDCPGWDPEERLQDGEDGGEGGQQGNGPHGMILASMIS